MYQYPADHRTAVCIGYDPPMMCQVTEKSHMEHGWLVRMTGEESVRARILVVVDWWERRIEITSGADRSGTRALRLFGFCQSKCGLAPGETRDWGRAPGVSCAISWHLPIIGRGELM